MWFTLCSFALLFCSIVLYTILASLLAFCYISMIILAVTLKHMPSASPVAQMVKNLPVMPETWVWPLVWEDPLGKGMATHSSILAWEIPWTEEPDSYSLWGCKESDRTEQLILSLFFPLICEPRNGILSLVFLLTYWVIFVIHFTTICLKYYLALNSQ